MDEQIARAKQIARQACNQIMKLIDDLEERAVFGPSIHPDRKADARARLDRHLSAAVLRGIDMEAVIRSIKALAKKIASLPPPHEVTAERVMLLRDLSGELARLAEIEMDLVSILAIAREQPHTW